MLHMHAVAHSPFNRVPSLQRRVEWAAVGCEAGIPGALLQTKVAAFCTPHACCCPSLVQMVLLRAGQSSGPPSAVGQRSLGPLQNMPGPGGSQQ